MKDFVNVKLTFPYPDWPLLRQSPGGVGQWKNYMFYINDETPREYDVWVVYNFLNNEEETSFCPKRNTLLITGEPFSIDSYHAGYVKQFNYLITSQRQLQHRNKFYIQQGLPWFINKTYDQLVTETEIQKTKKISIVASNKVRTDGHKKRLKFVLALKGYFGDSIELFGRGLNEIADKWEALSSYKYSVVIENSCEDDYWTEKIADCFLAQTFPLYYGCPNLNKYFNEQSFELIDIKDLDLSIKVIENLLSNNNHYDYCRQYLQESKMKCLNEYNVFPMLAKFIDKNISFNEKVKSAERVTLKNINSFTSESLLKKVYNKLLFK